MCFKLSSAELISENYETDWTHHISKHKRENVYSSLEYLCFANALFAI
jgi:hypothetical protein